MNTPMIFREPAHAVLATIMSIAFVALTLRSLGMYPSVFWDEFLYSQFSRFGMLLDAPVPSYLYYLVYRITKSCGDGFLPCARVLNVAFFVSAAPFIYTISRRFTDEKISLFVVVAALIAPINTYTAYFMPEAAYYFCFWVIAFLVLRLTVRSQIWEWVLAGAAIGVAALVKVHALFLLPALLFYFAFAGDRRAMLGRAVLLVAVAIAVKTSIGFLIVGKYGLGLLGPTYTNIATKPIYSALAYDAAQNFFGHLVGLSLLFGVATCQILLTVTYSIGRRELEDSDKIALFSFFLFAVLLIVVPLFTATVSGLGPSETNARLHMRYYNFAFPLLLITCAAQLRSDGPAAPRWVKTMLSVPVAVLVVYCFARILTAYTPIYVDCPELFGVVTSGNLFAIVAAAAIFCLAVWTFSSSLGLKLFLFFAVPFALMVGTYSHAQWSQRFFDPQVADRAGIGTRNHRTNCAIVNCRPES